MARACPPLAPTPILCEHVNILLTRKEEIKEAQTGVAGEFRVHDIPSCRFLPMADADKARSAELLNSEYSCQPTWPPL